MRINTNAQLDEDLGPEIKLQIYGTLNGQSDTRNGKVNTQLKQQEHRRLNKLSQPNTLKKINK